MKCRKCNSELSESALFCSQCGTKVDVEKAEDLTCGRCGQPLGNNDKFCPLCGAIVDATSAPERVIANDEDSVEDAAPCAKFPGDNFTFMRSPKEYCAQKLRSVGDFLKAKGIAFWNKRSLYGKVVTVALVVFILLALVAFIASKTMAAIIAVLQIAMAVVSILMHKDVINLEPRKSWYKYLILGVAILFTALNIMSYSWGTKMPPISQNSPLVNESSVNELDPNLDIPNDFSLTTPTTSTTPAIATAIVPCGADECLGTNYELLVEQFKKAGFQIVCAEATADLDLENITQKGQVYEITIDGSAIFGVGDQLDENATVKILYHDAKRIAAPISSEEVADKDLAELIKLFEDAGFTNLVTETKEDIDPEYSQREFRNDVSIGNNNSFTNTDVFPLDAEVKIVTHLPYEKYKVTLHINFIPNLFFNKYGVDISRGYTELGTLSHGEDDDFEMWLRPGKYTFTFTRVSYTKPTKEITIDVKGEAEIFYNLSCYEDSIHIEKTAHIDIGAIGENEAAVPASNLDFKYKNYKEVEKQLKEAGFTNISTSILYDIVFGWTDEGEVDSVKINGKTDYILGDIFAKDTPIVITYHMLEEDDPNKPVETDVPTTEAITDPTDIAITMPADSTSYTGKHYLEVQAELEQLGFTNIEVRETETNDKKSVDGATESVLADSNAFSAGDILSSSLPITIQRTEFVDTEYELAFIRRTGQYSIFYLFDTDKQEVAYFYTDDIGVSKGRYWGDFSTGVTISWEHGQFTEKFIYTGEYDATLVDGNGHRWDYVVCSLRYAQDKLDSN